MPLDRTWYNTLVDDDGSALTGTPWDKSAVDSLMDAIDAALPAANIQTTTSTGTQNNFSQTVARAVLLRCNNASLLTITGFTAGNDGDVLDVVSVGAGQVDFAHQNGSSTAGNRLINCATSGTTSLAAGSGTARYIYDATTARWRLTRHEQGAWITPAYAAGTYTTGAGTWTVDAGDVTSHKYRLSGRTLIFSVRIDTSSVASSPSELRVGLPAGLTSAISGQDSAVIFDNSLTTSDNGVAAVSSSGVFVAIFLKGFGAWATATNTTGLRFTLTLEVQ